MNEIRLHPKLLVIEAITMMRSHSAMCLPVYEGSRFKEQVSYDDLMAFLNHKERGQNVYYHKLNFDLETALIFIRTMRYQRIERFKLISAVAVLSLLLGVGWLFWQNNLMAKNQPVPDLAVKKSQMLVLTLSDGKQIALNEKHKGIIIKGHKLIYDDGTKVADVGLRGGDRELRLSTPKGKTYQITLSDGTKVWLNSASSIGFPSEFEDNHRTVKLNGEGYFEVAKAKQARFIVVSKQQQVEVLGTHFNLSAYDDEEATKTTLFEGSVKVSPLTAVPSSLVQEAKREVLNNKTAILKPGQQSILKGRKPLLVKVIDTEDAVGWRRGELVFRNEPLKNIFLAMGHWYDIEVTYQDVAVAELRFGGAITRGDDVSEALRILELTGDVSFKVNGKKILVSR